MFVNSLWDIKEPTPHGIREEEGMNTESILNIIKANLRPINFCLRLIRPKVSFLCMFTILSVLIKQ